MKHWRTLNGRWLPHSIVTEVQQVLDEQINSGFQLKACIGTDSQVKGAYIEFATVIVFVRKGHGAFMYIHNEKLLQSMSIKQRMLDEVNRSVQLAYQLCDLFWKYKVDMEVHIDINTNPKFKSNNALQEAMGYIHGMGFDVKAKPYAFASSSCANKVVQ